MDQLAELAQSLLGSRELSQATAKDLSLLANSISKLIPLKSHKRTAEKCISQFAQEIARRDLRGWLEQSLAMAASALSKVEGEEITEALKKIAKVVLRCQKIWTEQQLAMLANGLSKVEGKEITGALREIAQEVNRLGVKGWTEQQLAMLATGLSKVEGEEISEALKKVAQEVNRVGVEGWREQHLAMLAIGLSKAEGREITEALREIAQELNRLGVKGWTEQQLAMLAIGLSKAEGREITEALREIAQQVNRLGVEGWTEQHQTMLAIGLSKAEGREITKALKKIAEVVRRGKKVWTEKQLAMLASGLSKVEGKEITGALKEVAQEVTQKNVKMWAEQDLIMLISGWGAIAGHPAFSACVNELVSRHSSKWWLTALGNLCRLQLSEYQAQAGLDIVMALDKQDFKPEDRHQGKDLVWCLTLLHFVFDKQEDEASCQACQRLRGLYEKFAGYLGHYPASSDGFGLKPVDDLWQEYYVHGYWKEDKSLPVPLVTYPINEPSVSRLQKKIFSAIGREVPWAKVREEVYINGFPVDMLVGENVCVEVDGPGHYIYSDHPGLYDSVTGKEKPVAAPRLQKYQRAKDHFIDHMLEKYGYSVFRIPYDMGTDSRQFHRVIQNIRESLNRAD